MKSRVTCLSGAVQIKETTNNCLFSIDDNLFNYIKKKIVQDNKSGLVFKSDIEKNKPHEQNITISTLIHK